MKNKWIIMGTWSFAKRHIAKGASVLAENGSAIDAAVAMAKGIEADPTVDSVGLGGLPGWDGVVDLDAAIMDGKNLEVGAVGSLKGFAHPIEVAKDVMLHTGHDLLVAGGAEQFADRMGHERINLLTPNALLRWQELRSEENARPDNFDNIKRHGVQGKPVGHDTVGIVARDCEGHFCAATSTSGLALKLPGRVGDSPICGAGFYADDRRGAAAATGVGEDIMRTTLSYRIVERMGRGEDALSACENAMREACADMSAAGRDVGEMAVVALDVNGNCGYAANHDTFCYAHASADAQESLTTIKSCVK